MSDGFFEGEPLRADECPVCHGPLAEKNDGLWCPDCELGFRGD